MARLRKTIAPIIPPSEDAQLAEQLLRALIKDFKSNWRGWSDPQLLDFIELILGVRLPNTVMTSGHSSPAQFVCDAFFERFDTALVLANRTGGKTYNVALINVLNSLAKKGCDTTQAGATRDQAKRGYEYLKKFANSAFIQQFLRHEPTQHETVFTNSARVGIITGTPTGLRSPHPHKAELDEVDLMSWESIQTGFSMAQSGTYRGEKIAAQNILTSTRNSTTGPVQRLLNEAEQRAIKVYKWNIFEVLAKCERLCKNDLTFGNCPAYDRKDKDGNDTPMCGGKAHDCDGYYAIPDFLSKVRNLDIDTWVFEWLCDVTVSGKQVYGKFYKDEQPFVVVPFIIPSHWKAWMGRDSGQHSRVYKVAEDPDTGIWYVCWGLILDTNQLYEDQTRWIKASPLWRPSQLMYCDPADKQAIEEFKRRGINAVKADNAVTAGINTLKERMSLNWVVRQYDSTKQADELLKLPGLRIFSTLTTLRNGLLRYSHPEKEDGTFDEDIVLKEDDHDVDCLRYALHSKLQGKNSGGSIRLAKLHL